MSPLGFAACQSKKCTNQARSTPILNPPTDFTDLHRSLLLRRDSHRIHGFTQMQANCSVNSVNSVGVLRYINICVDPCNLWENILCQSVLCVPCNLWEPQAAWEKFIAEKKTPTDFTDLHRSLLLKRNSHRFHGFTQM